MLDVQDVTRNLYFLIIIKIIKHGVKKKVIWVIPPVINAYLFYVFKKIKTIELLILWPLVKNFIMDG